MLLLRTTGRRSGKARTAALLYVRDGDDYVVIASTGDGDQHPGWYFNLKDDAPAELQVGRTTLAVAAADATGDPENACGPTPTASTKAATPSTSRAPTARSPSWCSALPDHLGGCGAKARPTAMSADPAPGENHACNHAGRSIVDTGRVTRPILRLARSPRALGSIAIAVLFVAGACSGGEQPQLVAAEPTATLVPAPTAVPEPTVATEPTPDPAATAEVEPTPEPEPALPVWQVVETVDNLNLRSDPTTSAEILANFGPGDSGITGTGQTATADGFDWVEIAADEGRPPGWVAAQFVVPDESVVSRVCFNTADGSGATTIALDFGADANTFTGGMRTVTSDELQYDAVAARRLEGTTFAVTVQSVPGGAERTEEWISGTAGMVIDGDKSIGAANCADINEFVMSIDISVTTYPDIPG